MGGVESKTERETGKRVKIEQFNGTLTVIGWSPSGPGFGGRAVCRIFRGKGELGSPCGFKQCGEGGVLVQLDVVVCFVRSALDMAVERDVRRFYVAVGSALWGQ